MSWDVILLDEVDRWLLRLVEVDGKAAAAAIAAINMLEDRGPALGRPVVDRVKGSKFHHLKELRPSGTSIRILFNFDPSRQAILLVGGDKSGNWKKWYRQNIPVAERRYEDWLSSEAGGG